MTTAMATAIAAVWVRSGHGATCSGIVGFLVHRPGSVSRVDELCEGKGAFDYVGYVAFVRFFRVIVVVQVLLGVLRRPLLAQLK